MIKKVELLNWIDVYDNLKYPFGIYNELVVEGKDLLEKFALMGAWKTGSLLIDYNGREYEDKNGVLYAYTGRWNNSTPVGFEIWKYISNNQCEIKNRIPINFPLDKPEIVLELQSQKGFGIIWSLFVLHCFYPTIYPLFDQHVYRAYRALVTKDNKYIDVAPDNWCEYSNYRNFFNKLIAEFKINYWELDRALWSYGKHIKEVMKINAGKDGISESVNKNNEQTTFVPNYYDEWLHSTTLGGKAKSFWWKLDKSSTLHIKRNFNDSKNEIIKIISQEELEKINNFMITGEWIDLANNVEKLNMGTEKSGIGKFLYESLSWSVTDAQLASQLGVVFLLAGCWIHNGMKRGIKFQKINSAYIENIRYYYEKELSEELI